MIFIFFRYISVCNYDEIYDKHCPVFRLDYILKKADDCKKPFHGLRHPQFVAGIAAAVAEPPV